MYNQISKTKKAVRQIKQAIPLQTLQRLPAYLSYLRRVLPDKKNVSARTIAAALSLGEIQVRKDLAAVSDKGRPKTGYDTAELIADIEDTLGCTNSKDAVLIGAGKLGTALLSYKGFSEYGLNIVSAFDTDKSKCGTDESGKAVLPMEKLTDFCKRLNIRIGIITVPAAHAQEICDKLVDCGIKAVWNFAPVHLNAPPGVLVKSENMAASLALLSRHLMEPDTSPDKDEK